MHHIRQYNSIFAFTSLGVHIDRNINTGNGPYVFRINGVVHHRIGSLLPEPGNRPEYAQLYIYDTEHEISNRLGIFRNDDSTNDLEPNIVADIIKMLDTYNPLVQKFRMARDRLLSPNAPNISIKLIGTQRAHGDRYCLPSVSELAALIVGNSDSGIGEFDIIVECQSGQFKRIHPTHPALMALQYPLLFPYGEMGFHLGIKYKQIGNEPLKGRENITMLEYYSYYEHYRKNEPNPYTCSGRLSDQACVNAYSCIESERLTYHFFHQSELRSETYQGITEAVTKGATMGKHVGVKRILPSSFVGSKRYLIQNYHDSMAICRVYGAPKYFVTYTCNSNWPEITEALRCEPGQKPRDRNDIIVRVFHMKLHELLDDIKEGVVFGPVIGGNYLINIFFQS